jgi:hypothetical protein
MPLAAGAAGQKHCPAPRWQGGTSSDSRWMAVGGNETGDVTRLDVLGGLGNPRLRGGLARIKMGRSSKEDRPCLDLHPR